MQRRLTTILAADIAGFSRLIGLDEEGTLTSLRAHRTEFIDPLLQQHNGRVANTAGDSLLIEFPSAVEAVRCALAMQEGMTSRNASISEDLRIEYRIGINVGDVVAEGDDLLGDGVNVAARLEAIAPARGIILSRTTRDHIRDRLGVELEDLGEVEVKNVARPVRVFRVVNRTGNRAPYVGPRSPLQLGWPAAVVILALALVTVTVTVTWHLWNETAKQVPIERPSGLPAIAVLPFDNMSGDPTQDYFSDGITDDLITDLSRVSGLFVMARNTVFTYKGTAVKVQKVGQDLGVSYVLEGSVRKAGERVRINVQLVRTSSGHHVWADRFDRELTDVFSVQDEVVQKIVSALAVRLTKTEQARLAEPKKVNPDAYDLLLRGLEKFRRFTPDSHREARQYFIEALEIDTRFARAHADLAWSHAIDVAFGWTKTPEESMKAAIKHANAALSIDPTVPQVHMALSNIYRRQRKFDQSLAEARKVIELDPNYADGYAQLANALVSEGEHEAALKAIDTAKRLNPQNPFFFRLIYARAKFHLEQYEEATDAFRSVVESNPQFIAGQLGLAASLGQLGRTDDAEWQAQEILILDPNFTLMNERSRDPYRRAEDMNRFIKGLELAGLPK